MSLFRKDFEFKKETDIDESLSLEVSRRTDLGINVKDFGASGSTQTTTGSIISGQNVLTLQSALDFENGQGISIHHAGPIPSIVTPSAPTVTVSGNTGSTTYQYQVAAVNKNGGVSIASAVTQITNGNNALSLGVSNPSGALTLSKTGSGSSLSATTYYVAYANRNSLGSTTKGSTQSSTTVTAGQFINATISFDTGVSSIDLFVDTVSTPKRLATISKTGTITYDGGITSGLSVTVNGSKITVSIGVSASGTGASASGTNTTISYNAISWNSVAGATRYAVYGRTSGSMTLLAIVVGATFWNDGGTTSNTTPFSPLWNSPPTSVLAETFNTTIVAGGKTKTLLLADNAITTSTSQTIRHDDTDAMLRAIASGKRIYLPENSTFFIRKQLTLSNNQILYGAAPENSILIQTHECFDSDTYTSMIALTGDNPTLSHFTVRNNMDFITNCVEFVALNGDSSKPFQACMSFVKTNGGYKGVNIATGIEARLEYCLFKGAAQAGVFVSVPDAHIVDCSSESSLYGLRTTTGTGTITVHHFHAIYSGAYGFYLDNVSYGGQFVNCQADTSDQSGFFITNTTQATFVNCWSFKSSASSSQTYHDWHIVSTTTNCMFTNCTSQADSNTKNSWYFSSGTKTNSFINCSANGNIDHADGEDALRNMNKFMGCTNKLARYNKRENTSNHHFTLAAGASTTVSYYFGYTPVFASDAYLFKVTYTNRAVTAPSAMSAGYFYIALVNGTTGGGVSTKTSIFAATNPDNFTTTAVLNGDKVDITVTNNSSESIDYGLDVEKYFDPKGL
jgi:hypothetical protein